MGQPIVFVGGIHGVGKTSVSQELARLLSGSHVTAGTLIREVAGAPDRVTVGIGNKAVPNVKANQALLLRGLDVYRGRVDASLPIILDGHFSLHDQSGRVVSVPVNVFAAIHPVAAVLVETSVTTVRERLLQRDGEAPALETISALGHSERAHASEVCSVLGIPLWTISGEVPTEQAAKTVASHFRAIFDGEV